MATTWQTVGLSDIKDRLDSVDVEAVQTRALSDGQPDPWTGILLAIVNSFRGTILQHPSNVLGSGDTVPAAAVRHVVSIAICDALGRFGLASLIDENRAKDKAAALSWLARVEDGKILFAPPETAADEQRDAPTIGAPLNTPNRQLNRTKLGKLF